MPTKYYKTYYIVVKNTNILCKIDRLIGITVELTVIPVYQFTGKCWQQFCQQNPVNLTVIVIKYRNLL